MALNRIQSVMKYRKLNEESLSDIAAIPIERIHEIVMRPQTADEREMDRISNVLQADPPYLRNEKMENYIITAKINYIYDGYSLFSSDSTEEIVVPSDIDINEIFFFFCEDSVYIADRNFDDDGAYILRTGDGDIPTVRTNGAYAAEDGSVHDGIPILHIIAETQTVSMIFEAILDSVRYRTEEN